MILELKINTSYSQDARYSGLTFMMDLLEAREEDMVEVGQARLISLNMFSMTENLVDAADNHSGDANDVMVALSEHHSPMHVVILDHLDIDPAYRNQGFGQRFLQMLIGFTREVLGPECIALVPRPYELNDTGSEEEIVAGIQRLIKFYERSGFEVLDPSTDAPHMWLQMNYEDEDELPDYDEL